MTGYKEDWSLSDGRETHAPEHNSLARAVNYRRYAHREASLQRAINEALSSNRPIELEPGRTYDLSEPLFAANIRRPRIIGNGAALRATADMPYLLDLNGIADGYIENLDLTTASNVTVTDMVRLRWDGLVQRSTTRKILQQIHVSGNYVNGWRIGEEGSNLQCDTTLFINCTVNGGVEAGESNLWQRGFIVGSGVGANNMLHTFLGCATFYHRVHYEIDRCRYVTIGDGCNGSYSEVDVLSNATRPIAMRGYRSENGGMLFKADAGGATFPMLVTIDNCGFHPGATGDLTMPEGGAVVDVNHGGSLSIRNMACQPLPSGAKLVRSHDLQRPLYLDVSGVELEGIAPEDAFDLHPKTTLRSFGVQQINSSGGIVE